MRISRETFHRPLAFISSPAEIDRRVAVFLIALKGQEKCPTFQGTEASVRHFYVLAQLLRSY